MQMICLVSLPVLGVMSVFSAKYRNFARQAFDCVARKVTLRKCEAGFDRKLKMKIVSGISKRSSKIGGFTFRHFEAISAVFTVLMLLSFAGTTWGVYNFLAFGNCNGPHSDEPCVFSPANEGVSCGSQHCEENGCDCGEKGIESNCNEENNFRACEGNCACTETVCG